jgi:5-formyltetrahydrofolate cyclo-ligase
VTKKEIRKIYKEKRLLLTVTERNKFNDLILIQFQKIQLPLLQCVHTYLAIEQQHEIPADTILQYLEFTNPGLRIAIPKIDAATQQLITIEYEEEMIMKPNEWGIIEPVNGTEIDALEIDLVLVPLLAFDRQGNRVGYGKGFYDRFLKQCRFDVIKVGLSYFEPLNTISDTAQFDIPLNYCITPQHIYEFG